MHLGIQLNSPIAVCSPHLLSSSSALSSSIAPRDVAQQQQGDSELLVPSVLAGRCKVIASAEISSIHQEKPTEHFVMYKEALCSLSHDKPLAGNALAAAGRSTLGRMISGSSVKVKLFELLARGSLNFSPSFTPKSPLRFLPWYSHPNSSSSNQNPSETVALLRAALLPFLSQHFTPLCSQAPKRFALQMRVAFPFLPYRMLYLLPSGHHTKLVCCFVLFQFVSPRGRPLGCGSCCCFTLEKGKPESQVMSNVA